LPNPRSTGVNHQHTLEDLAFDFDILQLSSAATQAKRLFDARPIEQSLAMLASNERCFADDIRYIALIPASSSTLSSFAKPAHVFSVPRQHIVKKYLPTYWRAFVRRHFSNLPLLSVYLLAGG
jgi:hypothetical protein